jgi:hypothetical protein
MAIRFDAATDRLLRTAGLPDYNAGYSWLFWVRLVSDLNALGVIASLNDNVGNNIDALGLDTDGTTLQVAAFAAGAGQAANGTSLSIGTWYHVALVRANATTLYVYLNGVLNATASYSVSGRVAPSRMEMGGWNSANYDGADCRVAGEKFYTVALTQAEIQQEMFVLRPMRTENLYHWCPMLPGTTERLTDYSGNGRDWTAVGTLTDEDPPPIPWGSIPYFVNKPATGTVYTLVCEAGSYALTGSAVQFPRRRVLSITAGSYTYTENAVELVQRRILVAGAGSYALTGEPIALQINRKLVASSGAYAITGSPITLRQNRFLSAGVGEVALTGSAVTLRIGRKLAAEAGSYALTGAAVTFRLNRVLAITAGAYALTGGDGILSRRVRMPVEATAYTLTGEGITFRRRIGILLGAGAYALTGNDVILIYHAGGGGAVIYMLTAESGTYMLTGADLVMRRRAVIAPEDGHYALTGMDALFPVRRRMNALAGSYTLTGASVLLRRRIGMLLEPGSYILTGYDVLLSVGPLAPLMRVCMDFVANIACTRELDAAITVEREIAANIARVYQVEVEL